MITINLIGAGKVGNMMLDYLPRSGLCVFTGVLSSQPKPDNIPKTTYWTDTLDQLPAADWFMIATPDAAIESTAERIRALRPKAKLIHFSGALAADVMNPSQSPDILTASLHPVMAIYPESIEQDMKNALFAVEGDLMLTKQLTQIANAIGVTVTQINPEKKASYHAACCMANNFMYSMAELVATVFEEAGLSAEHTNHALNALMVPAAKRILPSRELNLKPTGPIVRGDSTVIQQHLAALTGTERTVYKALATICANQYVDDLEKKADLLAILQEK